MTRLIEDRRDELAALCRRYRVAKLELFGSAAGEEFDSDSSDLDFLVSFQPAEDMNAADQYFGLLFDLEKLFGRSVDLVCASAMRNPYFIRAVDATRRLLYAA